MSTTSISNGSDRNAVEEPSAGMEGATDAGPRASAAVSAS